MYQVQIIFRRRSLAAILAGQKSSVTFENAVDVEARDGFVSVEVVNPEGLTSYNYPSDKVGRVRVVRLE
ncbi:hypothetical protein HOU66_gp13 [Pectobacterium phage Arno160]|uniref:Uncharacterized protein n=1 Tax=Pectobacterium phage Arno160 TaxID=2488835 RepID=A0A3G8F1U9_9CAUD|nr:hypothetical protein HOU66_gp13 [Pectobacterium phage Arno160]AZF88075.1 hypothetical protein Arno160_gp13 [Pectobacterium phage Arno160]